MGFLTRRNIARTNNINLLIEVLAPVMKHPFCCYCIESIFFLLCYMIESLFHFAMRKKPSKVSHLFSVSLVLQDLLERTFAFFIKT